MGIKKKKRSGFEEQLALPLEEAGFVYEPYKIDYVLEYKYTPDFVYGDPQTGRVVVEAKGYFRPGDTKKYRAIANTLRNTLDELVFILQSPNKKINKRAKMTMGEWCDKENINWFSTAEEAIEYALS